MDNPNIKLLWLTPKWIWPAIDGGRVATTNLIKSLTNLGVTVDLLSLVEPNEDFDEEEIKSELKLNKILPIYRPENPATKFKYNLDMTFSLLFRPKVPITMRSYGAYGLLKETLTEIIKRNAHDWDFIVYEGPHIAIHAAKAGVYQRVSENPKVVYRAHNREAQIWERKAETTDNPLLRIFIRHQGKLVDRFEKSLVSAADLVATVSAEDLNQFENECPDLNGAVVPVGYQFEAPLNFNEELKLLFLGRLDWPPNHEGLKWLLENVWPKVRELRDDLTLVVAGSGSKNGLEEALNQPGVDFRGRVPAVLPLYEECSVSLVPVFYGSGTRVKAIESSGFGRPCISTEVGVEGIGLTKSKNYLHAETEEEWVNLISKLSLNKVKQLGEDAFEFISEKFNTESIAKNFIERLQEVKRRDS